MAAKKRYQAKAAQIVVKVPGAQGGETYLRRGRRLPDSVEPAEVKRLLTLGLIEEDKTVDESSDSGDGSDGASGAGA